MSELMNTNARQKNARWQLLATVSSLAILTASCGATEANADDANRPVVWIELGGQLERMDGTQEPFTAPFENGPGALDPMPFPHQGTPPVFTPVTGPFDVSRAFDANKLPPNSFGGEGKISFEPHGTDWVFAASVRYGRSNGRKSDIRQTARAPYVHVTLTSAAAHILTPAVIRFSNARAKHDESHAIIDFQAGKDVGLGFFGRSSTSVLNVGVRYAQFAQKTSMNIMAVPTIQPYLHRHTNKYGVAYQTYLTRFQSYVFNAHSTRSFHGVGPSLSWNGSVPVAGSRDAAQFTIDWGINGALLFGRQKAQTDHKTTSYDRYLGPYGKVAARLTRYKSATAHSRSHSVAVPNLGGLAGMSLKFPNAKVSLGYRADFFFGAMDEGVDIRHREDMSFHGPFASISIGLGG